MTLNINSPMVFTRVGVPITVSGIAQVRVGRDMELLKLAASNFLGMTKSEMERIISLTMEGHQRAIMGTMSIEEIYQDRKKFSIGVREVAGVDVRNLGIEIISYTIKDVKDDEGYLESLGKKRTAEVKRDARIGIAEAERDASIKQAECKKQNDTSRFAGQSLIADAERKYLLQKAAFDREVNTEKAKRDYVAEYQEAKLRQEIKKEQMEIDVIERRKQIEVEEQEIVRKSKELEAVVKKPAEANKYKIETLAEGERSQILRGAEAEAEAVKAKGEAEAGILKLKGEAEADKMAQKAAAWKEYSQGAYLEMVIKQLPELTRHIASPLQATDNIVIVGQTGDDSANSGASKMTKEVTNLVAQLPPVVQGLTGMDLTETIRKMVEKGGK